jgi:sulfide:quinone oxidoreductase
MDIKALTPNLAISPQILAADIPRIAEAGFKAIICNRPDGEGPDQPNFQEIEAAAQQYSLQIQYLPAETGKVRDEDGKAFGQLLHTLPGPVLAYCRSGMRSTTMWALSQAGVTPLPQILETAQKAGFDLNALVQRIANGGSTPNNYVDASHDVVIVGGGAAGVSVASSLIARSPLLDIAIIDPADVHYYQPGWTMVGGGIFKAGDTARTMASIIPSDVSWIKAAVAAFEPENNQVILEGCRVVKYKQLVICPGLKLDWQGIEGLSDTLGRNGVTSNYRFDLAPYTWELVQKLKVGKALFTQPPMPIKCAGAPQKAMYLSADHWTRKGLLNNMDIQFCNAGAVLFGVADYVPALMEYVKKYRIGLNFGETLVAVDGPAHKATFLKNMSDGSKEKVVRDFDMIHVVPPQKAPDFVRVSSLADSAGWLDVDPFSLRHKIYTNVFGLGDVTNTSNAKTAAAARKQAPVVAHNLLVEMGQLDTEAKYDGYGSCPLTVERGKIVLAEFTYGGKLAPSFPTWLIDGTKPSTLAWYLKERLLPPIYWEAMLKGREWMAQPEMVG